MNAHWLDEPKNVRRLWRGFLGVLVLLVLLEAIVELHPHFAIDAVVGFHAWFGFLACAVLVFLAKGLGAVLKRPDDYYESADD